ncbi:MAG: CPBP family glutamic-type intramembrane protease [Roseobacter sp.]
MSLFDRYGPHEALVAPARPKAQIWRLFMGLVLIAGVFLAANQFVHQTLGTLLGRDGYARLTGLDGQTSQLSMIFLLLSFGMIIIAVVVALRVAHQRGFSEVLGNSIEFRNQFASVLTILLILNAAVFILPPWGMGEPLVANVSLGAWLWVLPFAVFAVLVQVSAEEILFRGYLQQQLAARFSNPIIWILTPALLFGWGHYAPKELGENAVHFVVWSSIFGIFMADLTARAGTLAPAIAVHLVNNLVAILLVSLPGSLSGLSLYLTPFSLNDTATIRAWLPVDFMMIFVSWLAARLALRR